MSQQTVVVVGANGLVGSRVVAALLERGAAVRAVVRREGAAPAGQEVVGEFTDGAFIARTLTGADAVVTTVHPMGSDRATQQRIGVEGNAGVARAAAEAGVDRLVHISTTAVYDRRPHVGDVDESSDLAPDDANDYAVTKRDTDAAIAAVDGPTRILVRPPAILGPSEASVWNTKRPAAMREDAEARRTNPEESWVWVHVDDLAAFVADLAVGAVATSDDPERGPVAGGCTAVDVPAGNATMRTYYEAVTGALDLDPVWQDGPAWTGRIRDDRARDWGFAPRVGLEQALAELTVGLTT